MLEITIVIVCVSTILIAAAFVYKAALKISVES
jgi:hypothetical protein